MNAPTFLPLNSSTLSFAESSLQSLRGQPESALYFDLSCEEKICETINESLEELDFPEFFAA